MIASFVAMSFRYGALTVLLGFEFAAANKLLRAADQGDVDTVRQVLERKPQLAVFAGFSSTLSPLHRAVKRGDISMCREILRITAAYPEKKNDDETLVRVVANQESHRGLTPLMMACELGDRGIVEMLLEAGAEPRSYDRYTSRTCLHYAAMTGRAPIVDFLTGDDVTVEHNGTRLPLRECVMEDMQVGSSKYIDQRSFGGLTALHLAAVAGSLDCARILLQRGAAIMVKTDGDAFIGDEYLNPGSTPLHIAVLINNIGIAHTIVAAHAAMMSEGPAGVLDTTGASDQRRGRRAWEGHSRTDVRSMRNSHRKLPYHLARERRRRDLMHLVDPRVNVDVALDQVRDAQLGLGAMRLSSICSHAIQTSLLSWLDEFERSSREPVNNRSDDEASSVQTSAEAQELVLPALPSILVRRASLPPRQGSTGGSKQSALATSLLTNQALTPTFADEMSPTSLSLFSRGDLNGGRPGRPHIHPRGHHPTADDFLLERISDRLAHDHVGANDDDDDGVDESHNNGIHHHDLLPVARPPLIRVQSESGLSQLTAFGRRRFAPTNRSLVHTFPDSPVAMIKSESFDHDNDNHDNDDHGGTGKDSDSSDTGGKESDSGSSEGNSVGGTECGVCLDATVDVEFLCGHQLCLGCSRSLTKQNKCPPHCPFCRKDVYAFRPATTSHS